MANLPFCLFDAVRFLHCFLITLNFSKYIDLLLDK